MVNTIMPKRRKKITFLTETQIWASKMARKVSATKPDHLSLILGTRMVEEKKN